MFTVRPIVPALAVSLLLTAACTSSGTAAAEGPVDMEAVMTRMTELATPGEEHARMANAIGTWKVEGESYWEPGGEGMPMVATAEVKAILGGRATEEVFSMDFMGEPFEGRLLQGYDNLKGEYWSIWLDSMSTWGSYSTGNYNEDGQLVLHGVMHDAMTPKGRNVRTVVDEIDPDQMQMRMFDVAPDGTANLTMKLNYSRAW